MREPRRGPFAAGLGLVAVLTTSPVGVAEPIDGSDTAARFSIEMAGHRRLARIMAEAGHAAGPFATDGCSGGLSHAWGMLAWLLPAFAERHAERPPWEACCVTHDRAYHAAGGARTAEESYRARFAADEALRTCVLGSGARRRERIAETYGATEPQVTAAYALIADAMFEAVRLGGGPCSGLPWRWGFGYPGCLWQN